MTILSPFKLTADQRPTIPNAFTAALFANVHRQDILSILGAVRTKLSLRLEFCDDEGQGFHATPSKPLGVTDWD